MTTTGGQNKAFLDSLDLTFDGLLDEALEWISSNLNPEDVFPEADLKGWAEDNGFITA